MTMRYHDISIANFNHLQFVCQGDDAATVLSFSLSLPPFNVTFNGVPPELATVNVGAEGIHATGVITEPTPDNYIMTITFDNPPPSASTVGIEVDFSYYTL